MNQWTYHSRLYAAAKYCHPEDVGLVRLVSFGCGVDAHYRRRTHPEILQRGNKLYTQLRSTRSQTTQCREHPSAPSLFAALDSERDEAAAEKSE